MANLLQVSSALGRAMESVDRESMSIALYPALHGLVERGAMTEADAGHAIAACAEGYAFPANLDLDPPSGGLAPPAPQGLMRQALFERWPAQRVADALTVRLRLRVA